MSRIEEFLELQDKFNQANQKIAELQTEIDKKNDRILELTESVNEAKNSAIRNQTEVKYLNDRIKSLENDKKSLENEKTKLMKDTDQFTQEMSKFSEIIESLNNTLATKEKSLVEKDEMLEERDNKIEEQFKANIALQEELTQYKEDKANFIEEKIQEMLALTEKMGNVEKELFENQEKVKKLKHKQRTAQDDLFGKTMQIDQLNSRIKELEDEIRKIKEEEERKAEEKALADIELASREEEGPNIGVFLNRLGIVEFIRLQIPNATRLIRLIVPKISDVFELNLIELFDQVPSTAIINLACSMDVDTDQENISLLQSKNIKLTNYKEENLLGINVNNEFIAIATVEDEKITGFYTKNILLASLISQVIMHPFIRGQKL